MRLSPLFMDPEVARDYAQTVFRKGGDPRYFAYQPGRPFLEPDDPLIDHNWKPGTKKKSEINPTRIDRGHFNYSTAHWDPSKGQWYWEWIPDAPNNPIHRPMLEPDKGPVLIGVIHIAKLSPVEPPEVPWKSPHNKN